MKYLILFLLVATSVLASPLDDAEYITVVTDAGGPTDVIAAANYAANMQAYGYTFTGALDTALEDIDDVEEKFLVFFDGKEAVIMDGRDNSHAVLRSQIYLQEEGYTIEMKVASEIFTDEPEEEKTEVVIAPPEACDGCEFGDQCIAVGTRTGNQYCDDDGDVLAQKAEGEDCVYSYECLENDCRGTCYVKPAPVVEDTPPPAVEIEEEKKPNVVKRVWRWFTGLFG